MRIQIPVDTRAFDYPHIPLPQVWTIRQRLEAPELAEVEDATRRAMAALCRDPRIRPGASVAVGVGSRGIDNLATVVRVAVEELKRRGAEPFIVPAMGSHGGATARGQAEVLRGYGITPEAVGAPIRATMEVAQVGALDDGYPVYFDRHAHAADAVLVVNRIKHHTDYAGEVESGIGKMCAIGLGKQKGASTIHRFGADGLRRILPQVARRLVEATSIVGGVALIENPYGRTAEIHAVPASDVARDGERRLLERARHLSPRLPFASLDVLVVDQMGKDISGSGLDTHVIGRLRMPSFPEQDWDGPDIRIVCVLDLTEKSHGNAAGLGLADMVTRRLIERIDWQATWMNHRTSGEGGVLRGKLPIVLEDAEACVRSAIGACGRGHAHEVRLARIRSTAFVEHIEVSEAVLTEIGSREDLEVLRGPHPLDFAAPPAC